MTNLLCRELHSDDEIREAFPLAFRFLTSVPCWIDVARLAGRSPSEDAEDTGRADRETRHAR